MPWPPAPALTVNDVLQLATPNAAADYVNLNNRRSGQFPWAGAPAPGFAYAPGTNAIVRLTLPLAPAIEVYVEDFPRIWVMGFRAAAPPAVPLAPPPLPGAWVRFEPHDALNYPDSNFLLDMNSVSAKFNDLAGMSTNPAAYIPGGANHMAGFTQNAAGLHLDITNQPQHFLALVFFAADAVRLEPCRLAALNFNSQNYVALPVASRMIQAHRLLMQNWNSVSSLIFGAAHGFEYIRIRHLAIAALMRIVARQMGFITPLAAGQGLTKPGTTINGAAAVLDIPQFLAQVQATPPPLVLPDAEWLQWANLLWKTLLEQYGTLDNHSSGPLFNTTPPTNFAALGDLALTDLYDALNAAVLSFRPAAG